MADDSKDSPESEKENVTYARKKNLIPGWDNDHLIIYGLLGLGGLIAYPWVRQWADNLINSMRQGQPQGQLPPNGGGIPQLQQNVPLPPQTANQAQNFTFPEQQQQTPATHNVNVLEEHERGLREQAAYAAALEKESITGSQSINMVPDRNVNKPKNRAYEAGSNVSAGF